MGIYRIKRCCEIESEIDGYKFCFFKGEEKILERKPSILPKVIGREKTIIQTNSKKAKHIGSHKVLCVELNIVYNSINEASRELNINKHTISFCANKRPHYKRAGGYHWEFID